MKFRPATAFFLGAIALKAAPIPVEPFSGNQVWMLPGGEQGLALLPGNAAAGRVSVPDLGDKEKEAGGEWRGILSVDAFGTADGKEGALLVEVLDPQSGEVFGSATTSVTGRAPRAAWAVIASSEQGGGAAGRLFDGDPATDWHSRYGQNQPAPPHWAGLEFGKPMKLEGVRYTPRQGGFTNGVARNYRVEIRKPGGTWEVAVQGESGEEVAKNRKPLEARFPAATEVEAFRFVIESDWSGGGFGTGGEIEPLGVKLPEKDQPVTADSRAWLELPPEMMGRLVGKTFGLRARVASGPAVVVGTPRFCRIHELPTGKLYGRSNGGTGPDKLGAGLLGFDALTEHGQTPGRRSMRAG